MARLDRLADGKAVAQLGAVLGRTFAYELLRAVAPLDELALWRGLVQLVQAEVLYQRGVPPQATYTFKHALIQEAAYQSLLRSTRQQYHQRTAQVVAEQFPRPGRDAARAAGAPLHRGGSGGSRPCPTGSGPGERATGRSAYVEAIGHFTKGLEVLALLPDTPERAQHELDAATRPGGVAAGHQGLCRPGSGTRLHPGAGACVSSWEIPADRPGAVWPLGVLLCAGGLPERP